MNVSQDKIEPMSTIRGRDKCLEGSIYQLKFNPNITERGLFAFKFVYSI